MGYAHPDCRSPAGRMFADGIYAAFCPGGIIEPPVTADCFGKKTSWGYVPARVMPQPSGIMFPMPTDVYNSISDVAVKRIVSTDCRLSALLRAILRFCKRPSACIPGRYKVKCIKYWRLLDTNCDSSLRIRIDLSKKKS